jgi:hypothetical protein
VARPDVCVLVQVSLMTSHFASLILIVSHVKVPPTKSVCMSIHPFHETSPKALLCIYTRAQYTMCACVYTHAAVVLVEEPICPQRRPPFSQLLARRGVEARRMQLTGGRKQLGLGWLSLLVTT